MKQSKKELLAHLQKIANYEWSLLQEKFYSIEGIDCPRFVLSKKYEIMDVIAYCELEYERIIVINRDLIRKNIILISTEILWHELAHFIAWHKTGDDGHGKTWRIVMRKMGLEPLEEYDIID